MIVRSSAKATPPVETVTDVLAPSSIVSRPAVTVHVGSSSSVIAIVSPVTDSVPEAPDTAMVSSVSSARSSGHSAVSVTVPPVDTVTVLSPPASAIDDSETVTAQCGVSRSLRPPPPRS